MAEQLDPNRELHRQIRAELRKHDDATIRDSVGVKEAADLLGISSATLRKRIKAGEVAAKTVRGKMLISRDEVRRVFQS